MTIFAEKMTAAGSQASGKQPLRVESDAESIIAEVAARVAMLDARDECIVFDLGDGIRFAVDMARKAVVRDPALDHAAIVTLTMEPRRMARIMNRAVEPRFGLLFGWLTFSGRIEAGMRLCDELAGRRFQPDEILSDLAVPAPTTDWKLARKQLREYGYCIIKGALGEQELQAVRTRLDQQAAAEREAEIAYRDGGRGASKERRGYRGDDTSEDEASADETAPNQRIWCLYNKGQEFIDLMEHPVVTDIICDYLDEDHPLCAIFSANIIGGGAEAQFLHQDQTAVNPGAPFGMGVNCVFCLDDFVEANGATRVVPGSHIEENGLRPDNIYSIKGTSCAVAPAGSAILFDMRLWHAGGASKPDAGLRRAVILTIQRSWTRGATNGVLSVRPEVFANMSDKIKSMLGFRVTDGLGSIQTEPEGTMIGWNPDQLVPRMG